jgi:hypothetical protein
MFLSLENKSIGPDLLNPPRGGPRGGFTVGMKAYFQFAGYRVSSAHSDSSLFWRLKHNHVLIDKIQTFDFFSNKFFNAEKVDQQIGP